MYTDHGIERPEHGQDLLDLLLQQCEPDPLSLQHLDVGAEIWIVLAAEEFIQKNVALLKSDFMYSF